mmetsp:Transcript_29693/g.58071  ORF Transcript_29693/g.58071 Transcript_29693/m.58071 type:complete len:237 (-) Transcript_29693:1281-1991(-)
MNVLCHRNAWLGWWVLLCLLQAAQPQHQPGQDPTCVQFGCEEQDAACWERVRHYAHTGRRLADGGSFSAAVECFTLAANAVRDERWLARPEQLSPRQRMTLSFLYTTAAATTLRAGAPQPQVRQWQRRAAHISAPSVRILFDEEGAAPPEVPPAAATPSVSCDRDALMREERWSESVACCATAVSAWAGEAFAAWSHNSQASRAFHAMGTSLYRLNDDANSLRALHAAFRLSRQSS